MIVALAYWVFLTSVIVVFVTRGGPDGRLFTFACIIASTLTYFANAQFGFNSSRFHVLAIDSALLAIVTILAMRSRSYWPMWFAGFHMIAVATRLAQFVFPASIPGIYGNTAGFWALPALGVAVFGVLLDRRAAMIR